MKKIFSFIIVLLFPFVMFSQQENIETVQANGNDAYLQTFGNGKNNLIFLFENKTNYESFVQNLKKEAGPTVQNAKIFTVFLADNDGKECWLRNFSENHQPSLYYYTKKINCGNEAGSSQLTKKLVTFFQDNKSIFSENKTLVFLIRNNIENIYVSNYSTPIQDCILQLKKYGNINIYPEIHIGGTLSLWLEKQYNIPMITVPFSFLQKLDFDFFSQFFKTDFLKDLFKKEKDENLFFKQLLQETLPVECEAVKKNEDDFFNLLEKSLVDPELLLLPNKKYSLDKNYIPKDLESLDGKKLSPKRGIQIRKNTLNALIEMKEAAKSDNCNLQVISAFRSYNTQQIVFMHWVKEFGLEEAQRISARPGTSQHQLGTAIDFNLLDESFENYPEGKWLANNAYKYGFILSFPKGMEHFTGYRYEPWHYRYVGKETALLIKKYFDDNLELFLQWYWKLWQPL